MIPSHSYRILIVGDAGVGKSSFSFLLCHDGEVLRKPLYTVGSDVEVLLHQAGDHASFFELIEVGGSPAFESSRHIWYSVGFDGIIGVCDVTNMNSRNNLDLWFREAVDLPGLDVLPWVSSKDATYLDLSLHPDKRLAGKRIPVLIVANKLDLLKAKGAKVADACLDDLLVSSVDRLDERSSDQLRVFLSAVESESRNVGVPASPRGGEQGLKLKMDISPFKKKESEIRLRIDL